MFRLTGRDYPPAKLSHASLIIIDAQKEYLSGPLQLSGMDEAVANIARLLDAARKSGRLLVGRGGEFAVTVVVQLRLPLLGPASGDPLLYLLDETPVTGGEILRAEVECAGFAALACHATATAVAFVEQMHGLPRLLQGLGS
jgi:hypothetical protein